MNFKILNCRWKPDLSAEEKQAIQNQLRDLSQPMTLEGFDYLINDGVNSHWIDAVEFRRKQKLQESI